MKLGTVQLVRLFTVLLLVLFGSGQIHMGEAAGYTI